MVYLSRIYTKTGDNGETALGDGQRVPKDHPRVAAYGSVDELNAVLGLLRLHIGELPQAPLLIQIQNDLFDLGADLCVPQDPSQSTSGLRIQASQAQALEAAIDHWNADLKPLQSFVLPGGSTLAAWAHLARTVCRRAERDLVSLSHAAQINPQAVIYLNRLSDLLFVLSRVWNRNGEGDVLWVPGLGQGQRTEPAS